MKKKLLEEIKKTVVFIGETRLNRENKPEDIFIATGVLAQIDNIFHLITAKHVVFDIEKKELKDDNSWIAFNTKNGQVSKRFIKDVKIKFNVKWIFHTDGEGDLAILPMGLDPQNDDIKVIPSNLFLEIGHVNELYDVFFLSFQPGIPIEGRIEPIIRTGTISRINKDKTFFIDGFAYPGNSGSPVFIKPSPIRFEEDSIFIGGGDPFGGKFIGIIGEYLPYQEIAVSLQTGRPRVIFEENTGLSKVWSIEYLNKLIDSEEFKEQLRRIKELNIPPGKSAQ